VDSIEDALPYPEPDRLLYQLTHKDVQLGYFKYTQNGIRNTYSGAKLNLSDNVVCNESGNKVLKFSNAYQQKIETLINSGYVISELSVNHIVYWFDKAKMEGYPIVLPEIIFEKELVESEDKQSI
jgi:ATP-dependent DNA helicase RecQ